VACLAEQSVVDFLAGRLTPEQATNIDDHLDSCPSCRQLLFVAASQRASVPRDVALSPTVSGDVPAAALQPAIVRGTLLGRYIVLDLLGEGGMGVVHAAFDPQLDRRVALKLLRPELAAGEGAAARLLREGRAIAKLAHPNVVAVFDVGEHERRVFVAMELVDGRSLDVWLRERSHPWREVVDVFVQAGAGLAAAHAAGVIHRDFKPANVLVGKDGRVRVSDFGLARIGEAPDRASAPALPRDHDPVVPLTRTGAIVGTPAYMATEQFESGAVDAKTDQFSFAVALHEALYGERPFAGATVTELFANITGERVRPPRAGSTVPAWLRKVVLRGLRARPSDRYPSLEAMLGELRRNRTRRRWLVAAGALALAAAGAGAWFARADAGPTCELAASPVATAWNPVRRAQLVQAFVATRASDPNILASRVGATLDEYASKLRAMYDEACAATHIHNTQSAHLLDLRSECLGRRVGELSALVDLLVTTKNPKTAQSAVQAARSLGDIQVCADTKALNEIEVPRDRATQARVIQLQPQLDAVRARRLAGEFKEARPAAEALVAATNDLDYAPFRAKALHELADILVRLGIFEEADRRMEASIEAAARGRDHRQVALGYMWRVMNVGVNLGKYETALELADVAERANDQAGHDARLAAMIHQGRARVLAALERKDEAIAEDRKSLVIRERDLAFDQLFVARGHLNLGLSLLGNGNEQEAATHFEAARRVMETTLHPNHPELISLLTSYGELLWHQGKYAEARASNERAVAIAKRSFGTTNSAILAPLNNLGGLAFDEHRYADSAAIYVELQRIAKELVAPKHPFHGVVLGGLGRAYAGLGKTREAREALETSIALLEASVGKDHEAIAEPLLQLAKLYEAGGERARADAAFMRVIALDKELYANGLSWYGQALLDRRDAPHALPLLERAVTILDKRNTRSSHAAATRFRLAQARWQTGARGPETRKLVQDALAYPSLASDPDHELADAMRAWLAAH